MENIFSHHKRSLLLVSVVTVVLFLVLFALLSLVINNTSRNVAEREVVEVKTMLDNEGIRLQEQAKEVGNLEDVREAIYESDSEKAASILTEEAEKRDVGFLMAVDEEGIVLVRTHVLSRKGDNVFETTPWGREAAMGNSVVAFGQGRTQAFVLVSAHPIMEDGQVKGAIFAGHSLKDKFASEFKRDNLDKDTQIAFYSASQGIIGSSFSNDNQKKLVLSHFSTGSDWIRQEEKEADVVLGSQPYFLHNVVLEGLQEENPGGLLVFHKTNHFTKSLILAFVLTLFFVFLFDLFEVHKDEGHRRFLKKHFLGVSLIVLAVFFIAFVSSQYLLFRQTVKISTTPFTIYNSTLGLSPNFDIYQRGSTQRIAVDVETGGEPINVVGLSLLYDPAKVQVQDILTNNSICPESLFVEKEIDNAEGKVAVSCGVPNGFRGSTGTVVELLITPIQDGDFALRFDDKNTVVLANDGLGTDVLRYAENGSYQVTSNTPPASQNTPPRLTVFSETHPNKEREYNSKHLLFSWLHAEEYGYIYAFDQNSGTVPSGDRNTSNNTLDFSVNDDGTYYFHVAAEKNGIRGPVSHYKAMVDTTPPNQAIIKASSKSISASEVVRFEFSTDDTDDLQPNFYLKIDDDIFVPTTPQVYIPFFDRGRHTITVRVFDTAGNYSDAYADINVKGKNLWDRLFFYVDFRSIFSSQLLQ